MKENKLAIQILFCSLFIALVLLSCPAPVVGENVSFDYSLLSGKGPDHWGDLQPGWYKCKSGTMQSPIDLLNTDQMVHSKLQAHYSNDGYQAVLVNLGNSIGLFWQNNIDLGYIMIDQTKYYLRGYQWHFPSEHAINGIRYDLELQIMHQNYQTGKYAVVSKMYRSGWPGDDHILNYGLLRAMERVPRVQQTTVILGPEVPVKDADIGLTSSNYFRYDGSLTTPPCTEGVVWIVLTEINTIAADRLDYLRRIFARTSDELIPGILPATYSNARPLQPLNNRSVKLYTQQ